VDKCRDFLVIAVENVEVCLQIPHKQQGPLHGYSSCLWHFEQVTVKLN